jgi:hypothetical protein
MNDHIHCLVCLNCVSTIVSDVISSVLRLPLTPLQGIEIETMMDYRGL